ncbi:MAG: hypothetical protein ABI183_17445 [Polyangiaceae bacterium]
MSDHEKNRGPKNLDQLIDEARRSLKPDQMGKKIDWEKVDAQLFARLESEKPGIETSGVRKSGLSSPLRFAQNKGSEPSRALQVGGLLAVAAAFAFVMHRPATNLAGDAVAFDADRVARTSSSTGHSETALTLTALEPGGDVRVDGELATTGRSLRALDTLETNATHVDLSSANAVAWRVDDHSHVTIGSLGGGGSPLVVDLTSGALEAQVTPVERGEAFAVDLRDATSTNGSHDVIRIAVHGTHLRVARDLSKNTASIDLSEGVVSIGFPPKSGSTYGKLVTAPAHIEIDVGRYFASDGNEQTVIVDKNPAAVRMPETSTAHDVAATQTALTQNEESSAEPADESHPLAPAAAVNQTDETHARPTTDHSAAAVDGRAQESIRTAARACAAVRESSNEVRVSVSSKLSLHVGADGVVQMARFEPPLSPEAQSCASKTIYKTHFAATSAAHDVDIPVQVEP